MKEDNNMTYLLVITPIFQPYSVLHL